LPAQGLPDIERKLRLIVASLFWFFSALVAYLYVGYPAFLAVLARFFPRKNPDRERFSPRTSLLISAFNEAQVIGDKIENSLALEYPQGLLEIIVISDCSTDGTDEIADRYRPRGVRLLRQSKRLGKTEGLNLAVPQAKGDILVFSDANAIYQLDAVRQLVAHFADQQVGYVVGNARYVEAQGKAASAESEGLYWKLETWLKQKESAFGSVVGGDGAIYAIRRELFAPLRPTDINDFLNPLQIAARGYRGVFEPRAVCFEEAGESFDKEFRRKVRIVSRSLNAVLRAPRVLLPWVQPRHWFALVSHKVLRWFIPVFLILAFICSALLLDSLVYRIVLGMQILFYTFAFAGWILERNAKSLKIFYLPYYFCLVNSASLLGMFKLLTGSLSPTWQTIRQPSSTGHDSSVPAQGKES
jgi:cellulose synthase/poly-beta-1,6-N-acetylglucosamine synthase-like glycosyltransferase